MSIRSYLRVWSRAWLARGDVAAEIDAELALHLEELTADYESRGLSREDALLAAKTRFGNVEAIRRACRTERLILETERRKGDHTMALWLHDLRIALRGLGKARGFTAIVLLTLALGIGANTAIFSVVEGVLLRPLPFEQPERLAMVWENDRLRGTTEEFFSVPDFFDVVERNEVFEGVALYQTPAMTLTSADSEPTRVEVSTVSGSFFDVLGVRPARGRSFYPEEDAPGADSVALLSHELWMRRYGGDPAVVGRTIHLDDVATTVVGVMGAEFQMPTSAELWIPARLTATSRPRGNHGHAVIARLREGVDLEQANANLSAIAAALEVEFREDNEGRGMWAQSIDDATVGGVRTTLLVLFGAVFLVLLIVCANVANLFVARALSKRQEVAIRSAMGASSAALIRQSMSESLLLSLAGGALGLVVGRLALDGLLALVPTSLPRMHDVTLNGSVISFAALLAVLSGLLFGLVPALRVAGGNLASALHDSARAGSGVTARLARRGLVATEIALAVVLVVGAGLLMGSFSRLVRMDPGFSPENVVSVSVNLPASRYPQGFEQWPNLVEVRGFQQRLLELTSSLPGVESAALAAYGPLEAGFTSRFTIEGRPEVAPGQQDEVRVRVVSPDYFRTLGIRLLQGRPLEGSDERADAAPVLAVNQAFADRYFDDSDGDPVGSRVSQWGLTREIVAVVDNVRFQGLDREAAPAIYPLFSQAPFAGFSVLVRSSEAPEAVFERIREQVWALDRDLALTGLSTLEDQLDASIAAPRFTMALFALFAALALTLAALGIYGLISYSVGQRMREIGVRMSFGASRRDVLALVLRDGAGLAAVGVAVGLVAAVVLSRTIESLLFGIERLDLKTFVGVSLFAFVVALVASYVPALRATRVDPVTTLRHD